METKRQFSRFLRQFVDDIPSVGGDGSPLGGTESPLYLQRLEEVSLLTPSLSQPTATDIKVLIFSPPLD